MDGEQGSERDAPPPGATPAGPRPRSNRGKAPLEHPGVRRVLVREIALSTLTQDELGERYGVHQRTIGRFAERHATEIESVAAEAGDETAGLWIAKKEARIAEYQADVTRANERLIASDEGDGYADPERWMGGKHRALRAVAEELGALPQRMQVTTEQTHKVTYTVEGVDLSELT